MTTTTLFMNGRSQAVRLPKKFRMEGRVVAIHREGDTILLSPLKAFRWLRGFFKKIRIEDDRFTRPVQGAVPEIPSW